MLVVKRFALLTIAPHRVVLTVITHPSADVASGQVDCHVEVAWAGVFVAVTLCKTRSTSGKIFSIYLPVEEKGTTEDEMVGRHHLLNGHEFEQTLGDSEGQGSPACCSSQGHQESDTTTSGGWDWWEGSSFWKLGMKFRQNSNWQEGTGGGKNTSAYAISLNPKSCWKPSKCDLYEITSFALFGREWAIKSIKAEGSPLTGSPTGRLHCVEDSFGCVQSGTGIHHSRGFSRRYVPGEACVGSWLWGTWYEGWVLFFPIPTTTLGQALWIRPLTAIKPVFLGQSVSPLACLAESSWSNTALTISLSCSTILIDSSCLLTRKLNSVGFSKGSTTGLIHPKGRDCVVLPWMHWFD